MYVRKIVLATVSILLVVVVLGSSTLAFSINRESIVSNLDFTAASSTGLSIAISSPEVTSLVGLKEKDFTDVNGKKIYFSGFNKSISFLDIEKAIGETTPGTENTPGYGNEKIDNISLTALAGGVFENYQTRSESFSPYFLEKCFSIVSEKKPIANVDYMAFKMWFKIETDIGGKKDHYIVPNYSIEAVDPSAFILNYSAGEEEKWQRGSPVSISAANALRITTMIDSEDHTRKEIQSFAPQDSYMENKQYRYPDQGGFVSKDKQSRSLVYYHNSVALTNYYKSIWGEKGIELPRSDGMIYDVTQDKTVYSQAHVEMYNLQSRTRVQSELEADSEVSYFGPTPFKVAIEGIEETIVNTVIGVDYYIYIDGWDADCFDAILTQRLRIDLFFRLTGENPMSTK